MKLISYHEQKSNLGDCLQSIALESFIKENKYAIELTGYYKRNEMKKKSKNDIIVNGWNRFLNEPLPFNGLFVGLHSDRRMIKSINPQLLIGCRDIFTLNELNSLPNHKGILSYCSSINLSYSEEPRKNILKLYHTDKDTNLYNLSFPSQIKATKEMIEVISKSELVETNRLHVGLTAIAVGTPVIIHKREFQQERYSIFDTIPMFPGFNKTITKETQVKEYMKKHFKDAFDTIFENYLKVLKKF